MNAPSLQQLRLENEALRVQLADFKRVIDQLNNGQAESESKSRQAEQDRQTAERYAAIFNRSRECVFICDFEGNFLDANPAALDLLGYQKEDICRLNFTTLLGPDQLQRALKAALEIRSAGAQASANEYRLRRKDGGEVWVETQTAVIDRDGKPWGLIGIARDMTARLQMEEALRQSEERFRRIFDEVPLGMAIVGNDYRFLDVNQAFCSMLGYTHEDLLALTFAEITHPEHVAEDLAVIEKLRDGKIPLYRTEKRYLREDQQIVWAETTVTSFFDSRGVFQHFVAMIKDITEKKQAEEARQRLNSELAQKNRELQNVLYAASHDLRSPLLNIQGFARRLEHTCDELGRLMESAIGGAAAAASASALVTGEIPKSLRFIRGSVEKMDSLIGGMLRLSRLGQVVLRRENLDMERLLKQIVSAMTIQIQAAGAAVEISPLPRCHGDMLLVNQTFSNLLDNAIKYRHPARRPTVRVSGQIEGKEVVYCVEDNGVGIAPEDYEKLWELFYRLNPTGPPGEGLGLNLVRRIVERHSGRVWVKSTPGKGSNFYVAFPLQPSAG